MQVCASRLRVILGPGTPLPASDGGYRLDVDPADVDAGQFDALIQQAGEPDDINAAGLLRSALALWRGPASPPDPGRRLSG